MANAEGEKLNLLREHRLSQETFHYHLSIISGGALTAIITLVNLMKDEVRGLGSYLILLLQMSIWILVFSFVFALMRNFFASSSIKNMVQDGNIDEYDKLIKEVLEEKLYVKLMSCLSILSLIIGLSIFIFISITIIF